MTRWTKNVKQIAVAVLAILSLSTSSIAACACSHHRSAEPEPSCHGPAHHKPDIDVPSPAYEQRCSCFISSAERSVKAETFKLKKHSIASRSAATPSPTQSVTIGQVIDARVFVSFYDRILFSSTFSRGPPR